MNGATARLREPLGGEAGERRVALPLQIGGTPEHAVRVPGTRDGAALTIDLRDGAWIATAPAAAEVQLDGEPLAGERELHDGDVLTIGAARVRFVLAGADDGPLLDVRHLAGNDTLPPLTPARLRSAVDEAEDADIVEAPVDFGEATAAAPRAVAARRARHGLWLGLAAAAAALLFVFGVIGRMQRVTIDAQPAEVRVRAAALLSWYSAGTLFVLPGEHRVRGSAEGYLPLERALQVRADEPAQLALRLTPQPGVLDIDTAGVPAEVLVDGAAAGRAPGALTVAAGQRTLTIRAPRHLDVVRPLVVEGRGRHQKLAVVLPPSWGRVAVTASTPGATLQVDGAAATPLPASLDVPAGVRRLRVTAPGARDWESSVVVTAGQTTSVGPLALGAPDARLAVRSRPAGAIVTVDGTYRGATPLEIALAPGASHDVNVALPGYTAWEKRVAPAAGQRLALEATLAAVLVPLSVRGEPADGEVVVDGEARGRAPLTLSLLATRHRIEVRRPGSQTFVTEVDLTPALARNLDYVLTPEGRAAGWKPPTETATGKLGGALRLVPAGSFTMGSGRREQGRRPNETQRKVTLTRAFYIGVREVTNAEFRRFRSDHSSGYVDKRSIDLDAQAVTNVSWLDAIAYCNWLSEQEGLPPAYEQKDGQWVLKNPATSGYRLPTEAEWEYAAGWAGPGAQRRYAWGDALPPPAGAANLAGSEALAALERVLEGWQDDYQSVAPPGKFAPSALGLYDLTGNVSEWTHDVYASFADGAPATDPIGPGGAGRHVVKGSNWRTASYAELRVAWREGSDASTQDLGFRVARFPE
ncbi:MAG: SUMF1/EgtB/PvdO family nonheme iron enzyme [Steroidobacteraceae bacterium]